MQFRAIGRTFHLVEEAESGGPIKEILS